MNFLKQLYIFIQETKVEYIITNNCYYFAQFNFLIVPVLCKDTSSNKELLNIPQSTIPDILYLYQDRWHSNNKDIKSRILTRLGLFKSLFARKCTLITAEEWQKNDILEQPEQFAAKYHSYGAVKSKYKYALLYNGAVVAAAYFSPSRPMVRLLSAPYKNILPQNRGKYFIVNKIVGVALKTSTTAIVSSVAQNNTISTIQYPNEYANLAIEYASYEWLRYLSEPNVRVVGAMGRLLKAFLNEVSLNEVRENNLSGSYKNNVEVMSYSDTEWSGGRAYLKLGFVEVQNRAEVEYFVCKESYKRYSAKELLKLYNNTLAESILSNKNLQQIRSISNIPKSYMLQFYRIKNMGSKKFLLHYK